jgi:nitronate monooxygenase
MILHRLATPIVLAPLAGGAFTPLLAAAVSSAGGLGFVAAGYLTAPVLAKRVAETRALTAGPVGVNLFVPGGAPADPESVRAYAATLADEAGRAGVELGTARFEDDDWQAKLDLLAAGPVAVVSFTFGCPEPAVITRLRDAGTEVWVTVTSAAEAAYAVDAGADVLIAQGTEAGGHRGSFGDDAGPGIGLLSLLQLLRSTQPGTPLVAAGGIMTGAGIAAVLVAGASAAQLGTAFLRCPEAGTAEVHRRALETARPTALTRAFTGRLARGIRNRFLDAHTPDAPPAYPEVHHLTAPLRQAGRAAGDPDLVNLWAGQAYELGRDLPAAELVAALAAEAREALDKAGRRLG